jgi:hypothetical protein
MAIIEKQFLYEIKKLQTDYAIQAVQRPNKRDAFEYGEHHGVEKGLLMAEELFNRLLKGDEEDESKPRR